MRQVTSALAALLVLGMAAHQGLHAFGACESPIATPAQGRTSDSHAPASDPSQDRLSGAGDCALCAALSTGGLVPPQPTCGPAAAATSSVLATTVTLGFPDTGQPPSVRAPPSRWR